jgi:hypothetical protein
MIRVFLRLFAGVFGTFMAVYALVAATTRFLPLAVVFGVLALVTLRYSFGSGRSGSAEKRRGVSRRERPGSFAFLGEPKPARARKPPPPLVNNEWPAKGLFGCEVVGESHYQAALIAAVGAPPTKWQEVMVTAELVCEPNNRHDPLAVAVFVNGSRVGYLQSESARAFRRRLERRGIAGQTTRCGAMIRGGGEAHDGSQRMYGIRLDIQGFS